MAGKASRNKRNAPRLAALDMTLSLDQKAYLRALVRAQDRLRAIRTATESLRQVGKAPVGGRASSNSQFTQGGSGVQFRCVELLDCPKGKNVMGMGIGIGIGIKAGKDQTMR